MSALRDWDSVIANTPCHDVLIVAAFISFALCGLFVAQDKLVRCLHSSWLFPARNPSPLTHTGAASIAARPLLHALLLRRFAAVQLCAELPELADLQAHLSA
jgi:hypothetical protein